MPVFSAHKLGYALLAVVVSMPAMAAATKPAAPHVTIMVDASDAPRKIFHAKLSIPAAPGTLTLYYPKWIPGEHGPTGPIQTLTGLQFTANGQTLKWRRDLLDAWTFHVEVPAGATKVDVSLDSATAAELEGRYTAGATATEKMAVVNWNTVLLYPAGWTSDEVTFDASLRLPAGWKFATPLPIDSQGQDEIKFKPAPLTTLIDSPVITGEYMRVVPLSEDPHQELDLAADSAAALDVPADVFEPVKKLTEQATKLFGTQHFRDYHFLYSLSDHVAHFGLEHHESNDSRMGERYLVDPTLRLLAAGLLPHEYVHSWNGKYRRPADLATSDYQKPMQDDLLWVYEGLTSYLGDVLTARSGMRNMDEAKQSLAMIGADLDHRSGRVWRNLQDTADAVPAMQGAPQGWTSWRRPVDYYPEDVLNWLWVDTIIRQQSQNKKSLDDFCRLFHGGQGGMPEVKPYTFDDIVNALNQVVPYDWRGFWTERLTNHGPGAPLTGIENSGWKVEYTEEPTALMRAQERQSKQINAEYSVGLVLKNDGGIVDTVEGMPAAKAGIGPGMKVVAVNGRRFTEDVWRDAMREGKMNSQPLQLLIENTDYFKSYTLDYHDGEKYPYLMRDEKKPDLLNRILHAQ